MGLRVWNINTGNTKCSVNDFKINVNKNCVTLKYVASQFLIMSVPLTEWLSSVVEYCQFLFQSGNHHFCDKSSAYTKVAVLCSEILSVPVPMLQCSALWYYQCLPAPMWQFPVLWYCQCLYQYGSALLNDTISACTNVAVVCSVILWVSVPMW